MSLAKLAIAVTTMGFLTIVGAAKSDDRYISRLKASPRFVQSEFDRLLNSKQVNDACALVSTKVDVCQLSKPALDLCRYDNGTDEGKRRLELIATLVSLGYPIKGGKAELCLRTRQGIELLEAVGRAEAECVKRNKKSHAMTTCF